MALFLGQDLELLDFPTFEGLQRGTALGSKPGQA